MDVFFLLIARCAQSDIPLLAVHHLVFCAGACTQDLHFWDGADDLERPVLLESLILAWRP